MKDKGAIKIICRIITLLLYIIVIFSLYLESEIIIDSDIKIINKITANYMYPILICAIPLIIMMIISLILKYRLKNESKINPYRIVDVITRLIFTTPTTLIIAYYIFLYFQFETIPNMAIGIIIFVILNSLMKFTLQETMSVSFITSDNL